MESYTCWSKHGEQQPAIFADNRDDLSNDNHEVNARDGLGNADDDVHPDETRADGPQKNLEQMINDLENNMEGNDEIKNFLCQSADSKKPLYPECKLSKLDATLELLKYKAESSTSDVSFTKLLKLVALLLPPGNDLPANTYHAKRVICPIPAEYVKIHACKNDCILYRGENENMRRCPICNFPRYKRNLAKDRDKGEDEVTTGVPYKVVWYLPIIPRLKRMYADPKQSELMRWHADKRKNDGLLRHPADGPQWRLIDYEFPVFGRDPRNVRFALSTDGMNPFGSMSSRHSTWPVLLAMYNLPPWLCMKKRYIMMSMLIQGPKQPGNDIDVYLSLLVEELQVLWDGVRMYDAFKREQFDLRAMLFLTIQDYPALANLSGQSLKGSFACVTCKERTKSLWLPNSRKTVYMRHRRFLAKNHPYRKLKAPFDNTIESDDMPEPFSGADVDDQTKDVHTIFGKGKKKPQSREKAVWKKRSVFWALKYWAYLDVQHCIDVMHVEKNVTESVLGCVMNNKDKTKDGMNSRLDILALKYKRKKLKPQEKPNGQWYLPPACYQLSKEELKEFLQFLYDIKVPSAYCANIRTLVSFEEKKLMGMKSHDCHVMMTQMLPVAIRNMLPKPVREALMRLCDFFNAIYQKVIDPFKLDRLQEDVVKTICQLEMFFPPSFFDVMVHLIVHIVYEIKQCGPVYLRTMYPFERFMGILKHYVRNRYRPEASIVEGYLSEEVVEYFISYMDGHRPIGVPLSRHEGRLDGKGLMKDKSCWPECELFEKAHLYVLQHLAVVTPYVDAHKDLLRIELGGRGLTENQKEAQVLKLHSQRFADWLMTNCVGDDDETLKSLARKPNFTVHKWEAYDLNGYTFYTKNRDNKTMYQNSSIKVEAVDPNGRKDWYYGVIEEIWELEYDTLLTVPLFKCKWVKLGHAKVDQYGTTYVNLNELGYKDEPFVLATQATQIFYVKDLLHKNCHVVMNGKRKIVGVDDVTDEEEYNQYEDLPATGERIQINDRQAPGDGFYARDDHSDGAIYKGNIQVDPVLLEEDEE